MSSSQDQSKGGPSKQPISSRWGDGRPIAGVPKVEQGTTRPGIPPPHNHPAESILTCVVKQDYSPRRQDFQSDKAFHSMLPVKKGEEAFAIGTPVAGNPATILVSLGNNRNEGLVPTRCLIKGTPLRKVSMREFAPQYQTTAAPTNGTGSVLFNTIDGLLREMVQRQSTFEKIGVHPEVIRLITNHGENTRDLIHQFIVNDMRNKIQHGTATFKDLGELPAVNPVLSDRTIAIYLLVYQGISNRGHGDNALYAGKTIVLGGRYARHMECLRQDSKDKGVHYVIGRTASRMKMVLFAKFPSDIPNMTTILQIAEQLAQLLFATMNQDLFAQGEVDEELASSCFADMVAARALASLASTVFAKTGWKPPAGVQGCNWLSAATEGQASIGMWLCKDIPGEKGNPMRVFWTGGRAVTIFNIGRGPNKQDKDPGVAFYLISGGKDSRGEVEIKLQLSEAKEQGLLAKTKIYPIVEFYLGGPEISHPVPYARLPEPGPYSDWSILNKLGLKIEWQMPDGEWRSRYIQTRDGPFRLPDPESCETDFERFASKLYRKVSLMIDTLMNVEYKSAHPIIKKRGPPILLKKFSYDHINQEISLVNLSPSWLEAPTLVSFEFNKALMRKWYPNLIIGDNRPRRNMSTGSKQRTVCDMCHTEINYRQTGGCPMPYDRGDPACGDNESCLSDAMLRRPCFFQPNVPLYGVHGKMEMPPAMARLFVREVQSDYWVIPSPSHMEESVARGPTVEEIEGDDIHT